MLYDFLFGIIGILTLTVYCLPGAFMVPQIAYWFMTPYATKILEEYGIERKMRGKDVVKIALLTLIAGALFVTIIIYAGIQGGGFGYGYMATCPSLSDLLLDGNDLRCCGT